MQPTQFERRRRIRKNFGFVEQLPIKALHFPHFFSKSMISPRYHCKLRDYSDLDWSNSPSRIAGTQQTFSIKGDEYIFCWCPAGSFIMGSPESETAPESNESERQHLVTLSRGFWLLETPVTQRLWFAVMGTNPSELKNDDHPVVNVSWRNVQKFLRKLNRLVIPPCDMKFQLPTEAQWEYACRANTTTPFWWGDKLNGDMANCDGHFPYGTKIKGKALNSPSPVKSYAANPWGLYDMHGNVYEWRQDWYDDYPNEKSVTDPTGPNRRTERVIRGGFWDSVAWCCRSANRRSCPPSKYCYYLGFRVALVER